MPATEATNPTKAALEAAVLDLTDDEIIDALRGTRSGAVKRAFREREDYTWPREARRNLLDALGRRLQQGRVPI